MAAVVAVMILGIATLVVVAYANTPIPTATQTDATRQESVIYYGNGSTPIARVGMHREDVPLDKVPKHVQDAVLAAEDRGFWHEPGVSPTGVARALFKTATGGDVTGGSTITQQLARNYYQGLSQERTISRKLKEILISVRLGNDKEKKEILNLYLNTVSFGRQAYGIQAAARAYFHKTVDQIDEAEAALLAAMIQRPSYFVTIGNDSNPAKKALVERWNYVLDGMVKEKWLDPTKRAGLTFPKTQTNWSDVRDTTQTAGYLKDRVIKELRTLGIDEQKLETGGLRITTTFDKGLQDYTAKVVRAVRKERNLQKDIHFGLTTIDPKTGGVVAAYGGPGYNKQQFDDSFDAKVQPGSSFKPIVLATALKEGTSLRTTMDGSYRRVINGTPFTNDSRGENGVYDLKQMTAMSINTAYVDLGQKIGLSKVVDMAKAMGIPENTPSLDSTYTSLPLGVIDASPVTMASVYSTFAAEGKHRTPHVIKEITDQHGNPVVNDKHKKLKKRPWEKTTEVFSEGVARDATSALRAVVTSGTGKKANLGVRPVAGKTGTTDANKSAWFVGYTPEYATSVAMWRQDRKGVRQSLLGVGGYDQIYGGDVPAELFRRFMMKALEGKEISQFGPPANVGSIAPWATPKTDPKPTNSPTPDADPTCKPNEVEDPDAPGGCKKKTPDPSNTPTSPSPGQKPCNQMHLPVGCNPDLPPADGDLGWWCPSHPNHPKCREEPPPRGPNRNGE